jgi:hypothetical protein
MNIPIIIFICEFIFTIVWLLEMNRWDNEKTKMMKDKFATPMGFFFIFLASPFLVILLYIGNYMADRKRAKK